MKRICLIDLSGIFRAAWHASEHQEVSAAFNRTVSTVTTSAAGYDHVAICCDRPPYKRKEIFKGYKEQRERAPEAMYEQLRAIEAQLDADGFHIVGAKGYEADDIIGTMVQWFRNSHDVTVFSADKDLLQLVDKNVSVISTATKQKYASEADVVAKLGVKPKLVADLLALMGDSSDNVPGIKGVGAKTAAGWINEIGPLDTILQSIDRLPERFREAVKENADAVRLSWRLTQLMLDAPINPEVILAPKERKEAPSSAPTKIPEDEPEIIAAAPAKDTDAGRQTTAIATTSMPWEKALEPKSAAQAWGLAEAMYKSRLFGSFPNPEAILAIVMTGRTMGLDAVTSLRSFHLIEGKPCPHAHLLIGQVKRSPLCRYFRMVHSDNMSATFETHRTDEPEPTTLTYTIEQAKAANLVRESRSGKPSNWQTRPDEMLRKTAAVQLARAVYPDVTMGLYSIEEVQDAA